MERTERVRIRVDVARTLGDEMKAALARRLEGIGEDEVVAVTGNARAGVVFEIVNVLSEPKEWHDRDWEEIALFRDALGLVEA